MKKLLFFIGIIMTVCSTGYCLNYPNITIVDTARHILRMDSNGKLSVKMDGTSSIPASTDRYSNITIRDTDGHMLKINTNGSINLKGE